MPAMNYFLRQSSTIQVRNTQGLLFRYNQCKIDFKICYFDCIIKYMLYCCCGIGIAEQVPVMFVCERLSNNM